MLAYIKGEEILNECNTLQDVNGLLSQEELDSIKEELTNLLID